MGPRARLRDSLGERVPHGPQEVTVGHSPARPEPRGPEYPPTCWGLGWDRRPVESHVPACESSGVTAELQRPGDGPLCKHRMAMLRTSCWSLEPGGRGFRTGGHGAVGQQIMGREFGICLLRSPGAGVRAKRLRSWELWGLRLRHGDLEPQHHWDVAPEPWTKLGSGSGVTGASGPGFQTGPWVCIAGGGTHRCSGHSRQSGRRWPHGQSPAGSGAAGNASG